MTPRVKICGITRAEDAECAVSAGADFLGFIRAPESKRFLSACQVADIAAGLPDTVRTVAVFVNSDLEEILETLDAARIDIAQLHGEEPPELAERIGPERVWRVVHLSVDADIDSACRYPCAAVVADSATKGQRGGTGVVGDWGLAANLALRTRTVLAGGLNPANVRAAVETVRPWCVDVSSGVESAPGVKDPEKVRQFVHQARSAHPIPEQ